MAQLLVASRIRTIQVHALTGALHCVLGQDSLLSHSTSLQPRVEEFNTYHEEYICDLLAWYKRGRRSDRNTTSCLIIINNNNDDDDDNNN